MAERVHERQDQLPGASLYGAAVPTLGLLNYSMYPAGTGPRVPLGPRSHLGPGPTWAWGPLISNFGPKLDHPVSSWGIYSGNLTTLRSRVTACVTVLSLSCLSWMSSFHLSFPLDRSGEGLGGDLAPRVTRWPPLYPPPPSTWARPWYAEIHQ